MTIKELVKKLQIEMNKAGESLAIDGDFGPKTQKASEKFNLKIIVEKLGETVEKKPVTTGQDQDEGTPPWYNKMWRVCEVDEGLETMLLNAVTTCLKGFDQYLDVARRLKAKDPENFACLLAVVHFKEASCDFRGVLHNGEKIVGTNKKTSIVPIGRGPFATWSDAAVDAIGIESSRWKKLIEGGREIGDVLWALERYNGTGYISGAGRTETSPYLWACSNINDGRGLYVRDGKFDPNASTQSTPGAALILKELEKLGKFKVT